MKINSKACHKPALLIVPNDHQRKTLNVLQSGTSFFRMRMFSRVKSVAFLYERLCAKFAH
jgi:hypothetical protein